MTADKNVNFISGKNLRAGIVKRHEPSFVFGMNVGPFGEEKLNDADAIVAGGTVERCAMAAFEISAVDDVRMT